MRLKDKVAIITGAGSGLGAETAKLFAKEGAKVVIVARRTGKDSAKDIIKAGGEAIGINTDVRDNEAVKHMVDKVVSTYGGVDILVNNAGVLVVGNVITLEEAEWDRCFDTRLKGTFLVSKHVIPHMINRGGGVVINMSSSAALSPGNGYCAYGASHAAMVMLTKCMALDFASKNIRVNCVCPGPIDTPMIMPTEKEKREAQLERWKKALPIGRIGRPDDVANAVLYLVSKEAEFITGSALVVDGGRSLVGIGIEVNSEKNFE